MAYSPPLDIPWLSDIADATLAGTYHNGYQVHCERCRKFAGYVVRPRDVVRCVLCGTPIVLLPARHSFHDRVVKK